jgi:hypothetical protein
LYPLEHVYSLGAYEAWRKKKKGDRLDDVDLKDFRQSSRQTATDRFWDVRSWDDLRTAVSFLTLMGKRDVLYVRGQRAHFDSCLPVLFRENGLVISTDSDFLHATEGNTMRYFANSAATFSESPDRSGCRERTSLSMYQQQQQQRLCSAL